MPVSLSMWMTLPRRAVPFSYREFDETIDSHLLLPNSAIFEKKLAHISPELFAVVSKLIDKDLTLFR